MQGHIYRRRKPDGTWSRWHAVIDLPDRRHRQAAAEDLHPRHQARGPGLAGQDHPGAARRGGLRHQAHRGRVPDRLAGGQAVAAPLHPAGLPGPPDPAPAPRAGPPAAAGPALAPHRGDVPADHRRQHRAGTARRPDDDAPDPRHAEQRAEHRRPPRPDPPQPGHHRRPAPPLPRRRQRLDLRGGRGLPDRDQGRPPGGPVPAAGPHRATPGRGRRAALVRPRPDRTARSPCTGRSSASPAS